MSSALDTLCAVSIKHRTHEVLNDRWGGGAIGVAVDIILVTLIVANIIAFVLETEPTIGNAYADAFRLFESVSIVAFTIEYLVRLWSCTSDPHNARPLLGRLRWSLSPMALIDLAAIAPFYLAFVGLDLRAMRVLRLVKMLRLAKLGRYTAAINLLAKVLGERKSELLAVFSMATVVVLLSSIGMYYAERVHQPDEFGSVPRAMLWTITNLTPLSATLARPATPVGLGLSVVVAIVGVGVIAMPTGIIGAGFVEHIRKRRTEALCPHCGKLI